MYKKADLHNHTTASDGKSTPSELVTLAKKIGLDIIAITDHDNTCGLEEGIKKGSEIGIEVIPGIELTTRHNSESIHLLGYFKENNYNSPNFQNYLIELQEHRIKRAETIVHNLKKFFNIIVNYEKILSSNNGIIARPHIAKAIIEAGYPYDWNYIFNNIIGNESPAYVPNKNISIEEGLNILKSVNAFVSLAHPTLINKSKIEDIMKYDFDGIEGIYPLNKPYEEKKFRELCIKYNKLITGGSDYHGLDKSDEKHGYIGDSVLKGKDLQKFLDDIDSYC
ncbi:PHP domain-containing protein [Clostridium sp. MB40-C1]|uniref:PHP domain-containing protein n=1 Tax=Clostridium sp. MB40-C1 TaxID=3070996 RepID=UPI0027E13262|nr:PHP domain-containing protein [Clostridium sp. MB40-C1]WMJ80904.1 PHP domain-containing protein [Clostridium sp. MB40-C1]